MSEGVEIRVILAPSLVEYFEEGMHKRHIELDTAEELTEFLVDLLNDSIYPIESHFTGPREITLDYRQRPFADPIF